MTSEELKKLQSTSLKQAEGIRGLIRGNQDFELKKALEVIANQGVMIAKLCSLLLPLVEAGEKASTGTSIDDLTTGDLFRMSGQGHVWDQLINKNKS